MDAGDGKDARNKCIICQDQGFLEPVHARYLCGVHGVTPASLAPGILTDAADRGCAKN